MKIVLDTNVLMSGIFFTGPPYQILQAWRDGAIRLVVCPEILAEYRDVAVRLNRTYKAIDILEYQVGDSHLLGCAEIGGCPPIACHRLRPGGKGAHHRQRRSPSTGRLRLRRHPGPPPQTLHRPIPVVPFGTVTY